MNYRILLSRDLRVLLYVDEKSVVHETFDEDVMLWNQVRHPWKLKYGEAVCISEEQIQSITHGLLPFEPHTESRTEPSYDMIRQLLSARIQKAEAEHGSNAAALLKSLLEEIETDDETLKALTEAYRYSDSI